MSARVCVVGSFMMDLVASAPRRPARGETVIGTEFRTYVGGKGFNQAVAAARAGAQTSFVGRLGDDDFGETFRKVMRTEGIDDSAVVTDPAAGTGVGLPVLEPDGQNSIIVVPRANWAVQPAYVRLHAQAIERADVLLLQLELPLPAIAEAIDIARTAETLVILNPAPFAHIESLRGKVDVLVPNEVELAALAGLPGQAAAVAAARALHTEWGCDVVATLGDRGAIVVADDGVPVRVPAFPADVVDTIGAGDTFCGYLAHALASGSTLSDAAGVANAAAALAVTRRGAADSAPHRDDVAGLVARSYSTELTGLSKETTAW